MDWNLLGLGRNSRSNDNAWDDRRPTSISLRAAIDIDSVLNGDDDEGGLQFTPNPKHLVNLLKTLDRKEVASALLVRALDQYQALHAADNDPLKSVVKKFPFPEQC